MDIENKYGTLAVQRQLLMLLKEFDLFCTANNIQYSMSSGTLLGAVRHKGFVPWDDDLDCIMDRANFNKFMGRISRSEILCTERVTATDLWIERCRFKSDEHEVDGQKPTLDLFVLDNCPDNGFLRKVKLLTILMLQGMMKRKLNLQKGSFPMKLCTLATFLAGLLFPKKLLYSWYKSVSQWGNKRPSACWSIYNDQYKALRFRYPKEVMDGVVRMPFEDTTANGFTHFDRYLRIIYGDSYMMPPSQEERVPSHTTPKA